MHHTPDRRYTLTGVIITPLEIEKINSKLFWDKVDIQNENDCWNWLGGRFPDGYGQFSVKKLPRRAHRVAYTITYGTLPDGMYVLHKCDNRLCVNPTHLFLGTAIDNTQDMIRKGRKPDYRPPKGDANPLSKLTYDKVRAIRAEYLFRVTPGHKGELQHELAERYKVSDVLINKVVCGKLWIE